jgi:hypothetical protein
VANEKCLNKKGEDYIDRASCSNLQQCCDVRVNVAYDSACSACIKEPSHHTAHSNNQSCKTEMS